MLLKACDYAEFVFTINVIMGFRQARGSIVYDNS